MTDLYSRALRSAAWLEQDAIDRARAAATQARADASKPGQKATAQSAVVSVPAVGPYIPPGMGEQAAMAAGAQMLAALQALEAERWPLTLPVVGGGR